jgi:hypothetical protein
MLCHAGKKKAGPAERAQPWTVDAGWLTGWLRGALGIKRRFWLPRRESPGMQLLQ